MHSITIIKSAKETLWTTSNKAVFNIGYYLIWHTKYRRKLLSGEIVARLKILLVGKAEDLGLCCGHTTASSWKSTKSRGFSCGFQAHADINAAKDILEAGLAVIDCGEYLEVTGSMKQELLRGDYAFAWCL
jgi:hypothetical protein